MNADRTSHTFGRVLLFISLAMAVPIVPFLLLGDAFETQVRQWVSGQWSATHRFWLIVAALSGDMLLPVPSSGVSTYAGGSLGLFWGALASWIGMTLGAVLGFAIARLYPQRAEQLGEDDVVRRMANRYGAAALVVTRPLPILAEACVVLMGVSHLPWRRFLLPVVTSSLVISVVYAATGAYFGERGALPLAVIASVLIPLAAAMLARRLWRRNSHGDETRNRLTDDKPDEVSTISNSPVANPATHEES